MITHVAFDADDTLWRSEDHYQAAQKAYEQVLASYIDIADADVHARLLAVERRNIKRFGYGAKGMTLSMIEAAIAMTEARITARDLQRVVDLGVAVLEHPVELLDGITAAVADLAPDFTLLMITKGDLFHQEQKIARSGLGAWFHRIEIVSEKDVPTYRRVLDEVGVDASKFLMIGNSPKSDIEPVLALGGAAVHVPYHLSWALDEGTGMVDTTRFRQVKRAEDIPAAVRELAQA